MTGHLDCSPLPISLLMNCLSKVPHKISCFLLSTTAAAGVFAGAPAPATAVPLGDLIFRGIQILQLSNISDNQEVQIGQQIDQQLRSQGMRPYGDRSLNNYVAQVGQRIAATSKRKNIPYTFQVVNDSRINAFATMGGYVYVTTGLLNAADNEAQLASVMAHEIAHIEERHLVEQMRQAAVTRGITTAAGLDRSVAANIGLDLALNKPRSRKDEFEADRSGFRMLQQAGYATSAMPEFLKKLVRSSGSPTFLSTHPAVPDRIVAANKLIQANPSSCNTNSRTSSCGLDNAFYQQQVRNRLAGR